MTLHWRRTQLRLVLTGVAIAVASLVTYAAQARPQFYPGATIDSRVGRLSDLAFSSDGRLIAVAGTQGYGVWDAQTGDRIETGTGSDITRVAIGRDGVYLAYGDDDGKGFVVDLRSGNARPVSTHKKAVTAIAISSDGRVGATGDESGEITVWDPDRGTLGILREGGHQKEIILLAFDSTGKLLSIGKDLLVVTWDVQGKRAVRRSTLQADIAGRTITPNSAAIDADGSKLLVGSQLVSEARGGMLTDRSGPARPSDLKRDNLLLTYNVATGLAPDPVPTGDFQPDRVALAPGGCFAFFTSMLRDQPRLHIWSLADQGSDLVREDLGGPASAIALDPSVRLAAVGLRSGAVRIWRVSGAAQTDCAQYLTRNAPPPAQQAKPTFVAGADAEPLIQASSALRLAVMRFEVSGIDASLGDGVSEMVAGQLSNNRNVTIVERSAIDAIIKELEIQRSGLTTADAVRIGRGLNARKVLLGSVRRFGATTYVIMARLVDVETQQVDGSREITCQNCQEQDLPGAVEALRRLLIR